MQDFQNTPFALLDSLTTLKPVHFTNLKTTPHQDVTPRFDDDDDGADTKAATAGISNLVQKKFLEQRKVFLWGEVNSESAQELVEKFLYLEAKDPGKPITFYINTPGGSITDGMAVYDTIKMITSPVTAVVTGMAASMGSILLCAAPKGHRHVFPHSRVLIHQPLISGRMVAPAVDINIQALEMERLAKNSIASSRNRPASPSKKSFRIPIATST
jgi:ATP-dependent Clp protease protease subunit